MSTAALPDPKFDRRYTNKLVPPPTPAQQRSSYLEAVQIASMRWQVNPKFMSSRNKRGDSVWARAEVYYLLRLQNWSYPRIGKYVGRDYTTIRHAVTRYCDRHELSMPVVRHLMPVSLASLAAYDRTGRIHTV